MSDEQQIQKDEAAKAPDILALEQNPHFEVFKDLIRDQAALHREMAQNLPAEKRDVRLQRLDMALGLDDLRDAWNESVENAREILARQDNE